MFYRDQASVKCYDQALRALGRYKASPLYTTQCPDDLRCSGAPGRVFSTRLFFSHCCQKHTFFSRSHIQVGGAQFSTDFGFGGCRSGLGGTTDRVFSLSALLVAATANQPSHRFALLSGSGQADESLPVKSPRYLQGQAEVYRVL